MELVIIVTVAGCVAGYLYLQNTKLRACVRAGDELCRELESRDGDRVEIQRCHYLQVRVLSGISVGTIP